MGSDTRIGSRFLRAGPAYGGSCFPKDTRALIETANQFKTNLSIVKSVISSNDNRKFLLTKKLEKILTWATTIGVVHIFVYPHLLQRIVSNISSHLDSFSST